MQSIKPEKAVDGKKFERCLLSHRISHFSFLFSHFAFRLVIGPSQRLSTVVDGPAHPLVIDSFKPWGSKICSARVRD